MTSPRVSKSRRQLRRTDQTCQSWFVGSVFTIFFATLLAGQTPPSLPVADAGKYAAKRHNEGYRAEVPLPADGRHYEIVSAAGLSPEVKDAVTAEPIRGGAGEARKALIIIKKKDLRPADYSCELVLGVVGTRVHYTYSIQITVPPATLNSMPATVEVPATRYFWFLQSSEKVVVPLSPAEQDAWLTGLRAEQSGVFTGDAGRQAGSVQAAVAASGVTLTANPSSPLGTFKGAVRIFADQLATPVVLPVSLVTKESVLSALPVIIIGLLLGYLVRKKQEAKIGLLKQQIASGEVIKQIDATLGVNKDPDLTNALTQIRSGIQDKFASSAEILKNATDDAAPLIATAIKDFQDRRTALLNEANAAATAIGKQFRLQQALQSVVDDGKRALSKIQTVPDNNVAKARHDLNDLETRLCADVRPLLEEWTAGWKSKYELFENAKPLLGPSVPPGLEQEMETAGERETNWVEPMTRSSQPTFALLGAALEGIHQNYAFWGSFSQTLAQRLQSYLQGLAAAFKHIGQESNPAWVQWVQNHEKAVDQLKRGDVKASSATLVELTQTLKDLICQLGSKLAQDKKEVLDTDLKSNDFESAIRRIPGDALAGPTPGASPKGPPAPFEYTALGLVLDKWLVPKEISIQISVPELQQRLVKAEFRQQVAVAVLLIPFVLVALLPTFTGTPMDYMAAFAWAFLTDLTTQSLATAFQPFAAAVKPK
jgi:hypothetical protein